MEPVLCSGHKKACYLKTGRKPGPNFQKSFYVCSVRGSHCDFVQPVSITPRICDKHPSAIVELQAISCKDNENRCYYRCNEKKENTSWCGFEIRKALKGTEKPIKSNKQANPSSKELAKSEKKELPSFSLLSNSEHKAPLFGKQDNLEDIKLVKDGNDSFTQWRDSPVKDTSSQKEKTNLTSALQKQKELLSRVQLSALPDKGARLKENIQQLESKIQTIDLNKDVSRTSKTHTEPEVIRVHPPKEPGGQPIHKTVKKPTHTEPEVIRVHPPKEPGGQPIHKTVKKPTQHGSLTVKDEVDSDDDESLSASNYSKKSQIHKPHNPENLRQTKLTEAFVLPKEFLEGSYSQACRQPVALYGGRMTIKRLEEVRDAMDKITNSLHEQLKTCPKEDEEEEDPQGLKVSLMPHQKHALAWLLWRQKQKPSGGILADDMGLGKTLTMISFIMKQKQEDSSLEKTEKREWLKKDSRHVIKSKATLIITPASLVHQWGKEIEARCKRGLLDVLIYHGPNREKNVNVITSKDVVLTTYKIVSLEIGQKEDGVISEEENEGETEPESLSKLPMLLQIHWKNIILDEAHDIRNYKSLTATSVTRLKASSRWMLTGTPIQNKLLDMYSLLRFLRFKPFDEYKVWKNQVEINERTGKTRLNIIVQSLLLRRTKDQTVNGKPLIKMTKKKQSNYPLTLSPQEQNLYSKIFKRIQSVVQNYIRAQMDKDSLFADNSSSYENHHQGRSTTTNKPTGKDVLVFLLRLRQCCCHLSLLKESVDKDMIEEIGLDLSLTEQLNDLTLQENELKGYLDKECKSENNSQQNVKEKDNDVFCLEFQSTKIKRLIEMLKEIYKDTKENVKCVVVSQWTKLLMIVKYHITQAHFTYHLIDGATPPKKRSEIVDDFNTNPNGPKILLLSLKAGGVGLNLIGGRHLFLLDNHWNPALEEQASDRIYRVGQKHDVEIHRFVCQNTIEEKILTLQDQKRKLAKDVLATSGQTSSRLQLNDLRMLFEIK